MDDPLSPEHLNSYAVESPWAQSEVAAEARDVQAELGWVIDPGHHGNGYGTEAVRALLQLCFGQLRLRRVTANCFTDNTASWRLMDRVGMRREAHTIKDSLHRSGAWLDGYNYALLVEEWKLRPLDAARTPRRARSGATRLSAPAQFGTGIVDAHALQRADGHRTGSVSVRCRTCRVGVRRE